MSHTIDIPTSIREIFAGTERSDSSSGSPMETAVEQFGPPPGLQSPPSSMATDLSCLQSSIWTPKASDGPLRTPGAAGCFTRASDGSLQHDSDSTAPPGIIMSGISRGSSVPCGAPVFTSSSSSSSGSTVTASPNSGVGSSISTNTSPSDWHAIDRSLQSGRVVPCRSPSASVVGQGFWATPGTPPAASWGASGCGHPMAATASPPDVRSPFSEFDAVSSSTSPYGESHGRYHPRSQDDAYYSLRGVLSSPVSPAAAAGSSNLLYDDGPTGLDSSCMFRHIASSPVMSSMSLPLASNTFDQTVEYSTPPLHLSRGGPQSSSPTMMQNDGTSGTPRDIFPGSYPHPSYHSRPPASSSSRMYNQVFTDEVSTPREHRKGSGSNPWLSLSLRHGSSNTGYTASDAASQRTSTTPCSRTFAADVGGKLKGSASQHHNTPSVALEEIQDEILEMAMDRSGSRILQKLISDTSAGAADGGTHEELDELIDAIIHEIKPVLSRIMCDTYANYMCQQLFQVSSAGQRIALLRNVLENVVYISQDRRGTHSLQALIACMQTPQEHALLAETLHDNVIRMALDVHATHVLQQTISKCTPCGPGKEYSHLPMADFGFIFDDIYRNLEALAGDPNGLGVVKKCITHAPWYDDGSYVEKYKSKMLNKLQYFVENPYANYAVQHALEIWGPEVCTDIIIKISESIIAMAIHKFASNVVETALKVSPDDMRKEGWYGVFVMSTALRLAPTTELCEQIYEALVK
ncbi:Suppressor protein MPT5, putative [Perkinsus marinus ATCC 50983]|uniref:Suppressor protein MPT5, putative n=1 Tax=Perkinsus marinus (strain ATCC 50983 / TXsc) TaxID=423536 RepID=C5KCS4_PERM5|nr:Suppressor protein MPT5, putative [Perkinsus marinus ATCC 50983]EER17673.1 Suppressor protein MPT5, putative [Perkinsus marinus ATCC 50983]|eukprot:XP_002785877.1 Suppressor protein MPT5, putative [Perkinsus marinus ATCC 50983]